MQSLAATPWYDQFIVVEPSDEKYCEGLERIGLDGARVMRLDSVGHIPSLPDIAIVATSAQPRFDILKTLILQGAKRFLLEKVVFQSKGQFVEAIGLLREHEAVAYCNFVNRYFPAYIELGEQIRRSGAPLRMVVVGGDLGLGCNAIHYLDLFEYLTSRRIKTANASLEPWSKPSKRGTIYKEFSGTIAAETEFGDRICIQFDRSNTAPVNLVLDFADETVVMSEGAGIQWLCSHQGIATRPFMIIPTSVLTRTIVQDIVSGTTVLPTVAESMSAHLHLFQMIHGAIGNKHGEERLCPVT